MGKAETTLLQSGGIYTIRNMVSGRVYVGAARQFGERWRNHRKLLRRGSHHSVQMQQSWDKHGEHAFAFEVRETIRRGDFADLLGFRKALRDREQHWMDTLQAASRDHGFNSCPAAFSPLGYKHTEETKAKQRATWTPERRKANSEYRKGRKLGPEHAAATSAGLKGRVFTAKHRANIGAASKGRKFSDEARAKLSAAGKKRKHTAEHRAMMSRLMKGRTFSDETRAKMSVANKGRKHTDEWRDNMRSIMMGRKLSPERIAKAAAARKASIRAKLSMAQPELPFHVPATSVSNQAPSNATGAGVDQFSS